MEPIILSNYALAQHFYKTAPAKPRRRPACNRRRSLAFRLIKRIRQFFL